jgi:hypothetical protein
LSAGAKSPGHGARLHTLAAHSTTSGPIPPRRLLQRWAAGMGNRPSASPCRAGGRICHPYQHFLIECATSIARLQSIAMWPHPVRPAEYFEISRRTKLDVSALEAGRSRPNRFKRAAQVVASRFRGKHFTSISDTRNASYMCDGELHPSQAQLRRRGRLRRRRGPFRSVDFAVDADRPRRSACDRSW